MHFLIHPSCFSQRYCCVAFMACLHVACLFDVMIRPHRLLFFQPPPSSLMASFPPLHWYLPNAFSHPPKLFFAALLLCSVHGLSTRRLTRFCYDASKSLAHCRAFDTRSEGEFSASALVPAKCIFSSTQAVFRSAIAV